MVVGWLVRSRPWLQRTLRLAGPAASVTAAQSRQFSNHDVYSRTFVANSPDIITIQGIKKSIPRLPREYLKTERLAVFLLTPSVAHLLDPKRNFIKDAVSRLCRGSSARIKTLAAVVDRVPGSQILSLDPKYSVGFEGVSLLIVEADDGNITHDREKRSEKGRPDQKQHISFMFPHFSDTQGRKRPKCYDKLDVPLANTIFQNGHRSTLLMSLWSHHSGKRIARELTQGYVRTSESMNPRIFLPRATLADKLPRECIPLISITFPRRIVAGVGNIIRQVSPDKLQMRDDGINVSDTNAISASQELESAVQAHFEELGLQPQHVPVWALVIPRETANAGEYRDAYPPLAAVGLSQKLPMGEHGLAKFGCHLHRVLSGGGGWGHKQGLLALDPETTFDGDEATAEGGEERALSQRPFGEIARPGDIVQFFIQAKGSEAEEGVVPLRSSVSTLTFGSIPPPFDTIPDENTGPGPLTILRRQFGALSEHGIAHQIVEFKGGEPITGMSRSRIMRQTKIDVPFSRVHRHCTCELPWNDDSGW